MEAFKELKKLLNTLEEIQHYSKGFNVQNLIAVLKLKQRINGILKENQGLEIEHESESLFCKDI